MLDVVAGALMVLVLASFVSRYSRRARHSTVLLALMGPYTLGLVAISVAVLAIAGTALAAAAAALAGLVVLAVQVQPWLTVRPSAAPSLTILTANLWEGRGEAASVLSLARTRHVDVLALQEVTPEAIANLQSAGIEAEYPYAVTAPSDRWNGAALFSRYPLREPQVSTREGLLRVEAIVSLDPQEPDRDPSVLSVHIHAPWPPRPTMWRDQLDELRDDLRRRHRPVVVAGDFNATLDHKPFRDLLGDGVREAVVDARTWWMRTYRSTLPAIWIDHVVVRGLCGLAASTHRIPGSDHRAVVVTLGRADAQPV